MKLIILLFLIIYNKINTFTENIIHQEYNIICENKNECCQTIHCLYEKCGIMIFNIWFSLDLLLSVNVDFDDYEALYIHLKNKIEIIYDQLLKINKNYYLEHSLDNKKLLFYINKLASHQIIRYNDILLCNIKKCQDQIHIIQNKINTIQNQIIFQR